MFDLENEGQDHVEHSQWSHLMRNIKIVLEHFLLALTVSRYSHFKIRDLENVCQGNDVQHSQFRL